MTARRLICALLGLGFGVCFYLAYRSDHTLSNRLVGQLVGSAAYLKLKHSLGHWLPVPTWLRDCLPSALWCFIATSLIGGWHIRPVRASGPLRLAWLPPFFNAGWELVQRAGWTDGRADWLDVAAGFTGWIAAELLLLRPATQGEGIPGLLNWRVAVVIAGFACMGFADVW